jgi:hypothetical protein
MNQTIDDEQEKDAATTEAVLSLEETARQLRELSDFLSDLAKRPLEGQPPGVH